MAHIELREYGAVEGRMLELVQRFQDHGLPALRRAGMEIVFIGSTEIGPDSVNQLVYALRFDNYRDMQEKWQLMRLDEVWIAAKAESEASGPLVREVSRRLIDTTVIPYETRSDPLEM